MPLDRQSIEKKDFPIGRRGYDPEAVDAHLRDVADEVDSLKRSARQRTETVASTASEQVRAVIAAAEASAAEITRQAEEEAREIRDDAAAEARRTRDDANQHAHDYVGRVAEATAALLARVDAMQSELGTVLDTLRTGAHRVHADLQLLEGNLGELAAVVGRPRFEPEPPTAVAPPPLDELPAAVPDPDAPHGAGGDPALRDRFVPDPDAPAAQGERIPDETPSPRSPAPTERGDRTDSDAAAARGGSADPAGPSVAPAAAQAGAARPAQAADGGEEGARLVALDMALSGTPREETERYLAEHFRLADPEALLDEVYATAGG